MERTAAKEQGLAVRVVEIDHRDEVAELAQKLRDERAETRRISAENKQLLVDNERLRDELGGARLQRDRAADLAQQYLDELRDARQQNRNYYLDARRLAEELDALKRSQERAQRTVPPAFGGMNRAQRRATQRRSR